MYLLYPPQTPQGNLLASFLKSGEAEMSLSLTTYNSLQPFGNPFASNYTSFSPAYYSAETPIPARKK
jgi:hypothetical protein